VSLPGPVPVPVVFDVNVLVHAVALGEAPCRSWPSPPPTTGNPSADCLGVINDAAEFGLWLSPHILDNVADVLRSYVGWPDHAVDTYIDVLLEMTEASGGGAIDPPRVVGDCPDWEDNRILNLVVAVGGHLVVSEDVDLTSMSLWRGRPILEPSQFAALVDGSRRVRRRLPRPR